MLRVEMMIGLRKNIRPVMRIRPMMKMGPRILVCM